MKDELVTRLFAHRDELLRLLEGWSEKQIASSLVHEKWTIKDMVGHISFRDQVTLDHIRESFTQGKPRPVREDEIEKQISRRGRWN